MGPRLAGIVVVLPIVAGPILLIVYLDHGSRFAAQAARAATLGVVPLALFALVFAYLSRRRGWLLTLVAAWVTVLLADLVLAFFSVPAGIALALAVLALHGAGLLLRRFEAPAPERCPHRGGTCRRERSPRVPSSSSSPASPPPWVRR